MVAAPSLCGSPIDMGVRYKVSTTLEACALNSIQGCCRTSFLGCSCQALFQVKDLLGADHPGERSHPDHRPVGGLSQATLFRVEHRRIAPCAAYLLHK